MSILKTQKKETMKFLGVFLPPWLHQYLTIYTLAKGITKATIIRYLIEDWGNHQMTIDTEESLIQEIIQKVKLEWKLEKHVSSSHDLFLYKKKLEKELTNKNVEKKYIDKILNEIE
jgi:6-pyruvoyl-tetrahydropterin synthase